jgi:stress-induced morphogen
MFILKFHNKNYFNYSFKYNNIYFKKKNFSNSIQQKSQNNFSKEKEIENFLKKELETNDVKIEDISGGCGTMFNIQVSSKKFYGKSLIEQHKMVNNLLEKEIKNMHGLILKTKIINPE